jgi:hypothetical protein
MSAGIASPMNKRNAKLKAKPRGSAIIIIRPSPVSGPADTSGCRRIRALYETTFFVGLRKAGMPEE